MADGIGHRDDAEPEGQRYPDQADADLRECRRDHGAAAAGERQPKRSDRLGGVFLGVHDFLPLLW